MSTTRFQPDTRHGCKATVLIVDQICRFDIFIKISTLQHMAPRDMVRETTKQHSGGVDPVSFEGECGALGIGQITGALSVSNANSNTFSISLQTQYRPHDILPVYRVLVAEVRKCG